MSKQADVGQSLEFTTAEKNKINARQGGCCAMCGEKVKPQESTYHHVITRQEARMFAPNDKFYRSADNGVLLHDGKLLYGDERTCHVEAHNGRYATFVADPSEYKFSHKGTGNPTADHSRWRQVLDGRINEFRRILASTTNRNGKPLTAVIQKSPARTAAPQTKGRERC